MTPLQIDAIDRGDDDAMAAFQALDPAAAADPPDRAGEPGPSPALPPDATPLLARQGEQTLARATVRSAEGLAGAPGRTGLIGHYEARDGEAGAALLRSAADRLEAEGVERVIGPMDGTTWDRYRLALPTPRTGDPPPFFTEPTNPPEYPAHFEAAGFDVVEWYVSQLVQDLGALGDRAEESAEQLSRSGIRVDPLDPGRFDEALEALYELSLEAFADNPYYSPIGFDRFRSLYAPLKEVLDPELVLVARRAGEAASGENGEGGGTERPVGFVLAFPDLLDPAGRPTRVIVKTLAVAPAGRGVGLGSVLVHEVHRRAAEKGYEAAIHALMHVGNDSLKISSHGGRVFRHYALYGRTAGA